MGWDQNTPVGSSFNWWLFARHILRPAKAETQPESSTKMHLPTRRSSQEGPLLGVDQGPCFLASELSPASVYLLSQTGVPAPQMSSLHTLPPTSCKSTCLSPALGLFWLPKGSWSSANTAIPGDPLWAQRMSQLGHSPA